jgi:hypothetical protein
VTWPCTWQLASRVLHPRSNACPMQARAACEDSGQLTEQWTALALPDTTCSDVEWKWNWAGLAFT